MHAVISCINLLLLIYFLYKIARSEEVYFR